MYNLVLVVLGISLTCLVAAGGASYMSPDFGRRRITTELVTLSYRSFDSALSAYRASNGGILPPVAGPAPASLSANALPWPLLRPYLGAKGDASSGIVALSPIDGMEWYYVSGGQTGGVLCLSSLDASDGRQVPGSVRQAILLAAGRASQAYVGRSCMQRDESAVTDTGPIAVTFQVQSGQ